uniref:peroxidase n=1 Tax=Salix viminalis TaxID=40686 RepID=A0A6N2M3V8_SALVM
MAAKVAAAFILMLFFLSTACQAKLSSSFYDKSCPKAESTIRTAIRAAIARERRMAASLIRLHFHDCFVQVGGPSWAVKLGRRDSTTASRDLANTNLPSFTDSLDELKSRFHKKGLTARDMVALSGWLLRPTCIRWLFNKNNIKLLKLNIFVFDRVQIYNASNIDAGFASTRKRRCPRTGGQANLAPLDLVTPNSFDNNYFKNLMRNKGLLHSDQVLFNGGSTDSIVTEYSRNPAKFSSDFASAMIKMGNIRPLTGSAGQIRRICSAVN